MKLPSGIRSLLCAAFAVLGALSGQAHAQVCAAPGLDGVVVPGGIVNSYWGGNGGFTAATGGVSFTLGTQRTGTVAVPLTATTTGTATVATTGLAAGDLVIIMQMQGANAGLYEYAAVIAPATAITAGTVTVRGAGAAGALVNTYTQNFGTGNTYQVIRVPQYSSATISGQVSAPPWDIDAGGQGTGGVFAIDVTGTLTQTANINLNGQGFRGGAGFTMGTNASAASGVVATTGSYSSAVLTGASKGEGTAGTPGYVFAGYGGVTQSYNATGLSAATFAPATPTTGLNGNYAAGSFGRAALGTAGGGGNDSNPQGANNQNNTGGGGGGNAAAGGQGGWTWPQSATACSGRAPPVAWNPTDCPYVVNNGISDVGGLGGAAATGVGVARVVMGGGGGAGTANNNGATSTLTTYPPSDPVRRATSGAGAINGANGPRALSGARGGGIAIVRAGAYAAGGSITANGYRAYNTGTAGSEGAGGGGAGGSIVIQVGSSTGTLTATAVGGLGGDSNFWAHGPGGGGAGGFVFFSPSIQGTVTGGAAGFADNLGGPPASYVQLNNNYGATSGGAGTRASGAAVPSGAAAGFLCTPALTTTKSAAPNESTAAIVPPGQATYTITVSNSNTRGQAQSVRPFDPALPSNPNITVANPPAPTAAISANAGSPFTTAQCQAQSVRSAATDFANGGTTNLSAGDWVLPGGCQLAYTFTVNIAAATPDGSYQNDAGASFLDPTRTTATRRVTPNTAGVTAPAGTFTALETPLSGVAGSNYDGDAVANAAENLLIRRPPTFKSVNRTADPDTTSSNTAGDTLTWSVFVRNPGQVALTGFQVNDTFTAGYTITATGAQTITQTSGACGTITANAAFTGQTPNIGLIAAAQTLPAGCTIRINIPVTVSANTGPVTLTNQAIVNGSTPQGAIAAVSSDNIDTTTAGLPPGVVVTGLPGVNQAQTQAASVDPTTALILAKAALVVTKTDGRTTTFSGDTLAYTITLTNNGPSAANGTIFSDPAAAGLTQIGVVACTYGGSPTAATGPAAPTLAQLQAGFAITTLPPGGTVSCTVSATVN